ncbi:MAG: DegV family protein [Candidatus Heimdallarchaeota archaeon]|nr:DegV family protein [Candidatus Heimdallarchaeota archaeon]
MKIIVRVVTDSSSDLPKLVAEELNITIFESRILFGRELYIDGVNLTSRDFYEKLRTHKYFPQTTPGSPYDVYRRLRPIEEMGEDILFITLPEVLSKWQETARIALSNIDKVDYRIYDSTGTSQYQGLITIQAARLARLGYSLDEIVSKIDEIKGRTVAYAVVNNLDYLVRGGRLPRAKGALGNLLGKTPILEVNNSKLEAIDSPSGLDNAIKVILHLLAQQFPPDEPILAAVMHSENTLKATETSNSILESFNVSELYHSKFGPTIGANVGPGSIGVAFSPLLPELIG